MKRLIDTIIDKMQWWNLKNLHFCYVALYRDLNYYYIHTNKKCVIFNYK